MFSLNGSEESINESNFLNAIGQNDNVVNELHNVGIEVERNNELEINENQRSIEQNHERDDNEYEMEANYSDNDTNGGINDVHVDNIEEDEGVVILNVNSNDENISIQQFDDSLPSSHSYMGNDMEELHGRTVHGEGDIVILPLFCRPDLVIVPGQILPLNLFHPQLISMMKRVIAADKTFGLMFMAHRTNVIVPVGVTCEIFSVKEEESHGLEQLSIKAEGRQRFKILSKKQQLDGTTLGTIKILPDEYISSYPSSAQYFSQLHPANAVRSQVVAHHFFVATHPWMENEPRYLSGFNPRTSQRLCFSLSSLQGWIYKLYNPYFLMDFLINEIHSWNQNIDFQSLPRSPLEFSHWITANLPLTNEMKIDLLGINSPSLRLRKQIDIINKIGLDLACKTCGTAVANKNDLFSLSRNGPTAAYVNPGGHVHETVTFYKAHDLHMHGRSSTEYSWFPGYAWTVAVCNTCYSHIGWKFTAANKGLNPSEFWGLARASLKPVFNDTINNKMDISDLRNLSSPTGRLDGSDESI